MSIEARINDALTPFGDPVEKGLLYASADKRPPRYYTFSVNRLGDDFADDGPGCERCMISVHLFVPLAENIIERVKKTKKALFDAGFTWPDTTDASDKDGQHIVFECEDLEDIA